MQRDGRHDWCATGRLAASQFESGTAQPLDRMRHEMLRDCVPVCTSLCAHVSRAHTPVCAEPSKPSKAHGALGARTCLHAFLGGLLGCAQPAARRT